MCPQRLSPKYHQIEQALLDRIRDGGYDLGGLPAERDLCAEFGAARITIRTALQKLQEQGAVVRLRAQGPLVVAGRNGAPHKRLVKATVDKFLDWERREKRKLVGFSFMPAPPYVAGMLRMPSNGEILRVSKVRSDARGPLSYSESFIRRERAYCITRAALERKGVINLLVEEGVHLGEAVQTVEASSASELVAGKLQVPMHAAVLQLTRVVDDEGGVPVQLVIKWYRADRFILRMRMSMQEDATTVWMESPLEASPGEVIPRI